MSINGATNVSVEAGVLLSLKAAVLNLAAAVTSVESEEINFTGASMSIEAPNTTITGNVEIVGLLNGMPPA